MKRYVRCAHCGDEIDTVKDGYYACRDNYLQVKYFEEEDGSDNIFCSRDCFCESLMLEWERNEQCEDDEKDEREQELF